MFLWFLSQSLFLSVYIRATEFLGVRGWILYPANLLKIFISCRGSLLQTIILSAYSDSLTCSFTICIHLISFCFLIALARTSSTILKSYGEHGQPCLVPDFRGIPLSFSPFSLMLAVGFLYIAFIMFSYVPVIPDLSNSFFMKGCWILSKAFSASSEMIIWFFFYKLFIWWITLTHFLCAIISASLG